MDQRLLPKTYRVIELAQILNCSTKSIYNWIKDGRIPTCGRIGREIRISAETVQSILHDRLPLPNSKLDYPPVNGIPPSASTIEGYSRRRPLRSRQAQDSESGKRPPGRS